MPFTVRMWIARFLLAFALAASLLTLRPNAGPRMDDNGRPNADRGCAIDPNGCPAESLSTSGDRGLGMDPNG